MQLKPYGLKYHSVVYRADFSLESNNGRKFVVEVVIVHRLIAPTATDAVPAAVGDAARLDVHSKLRQSAGYNEDL